MVTCKWEEAGFRSAATAILNGGRGFRVKVSPVHTLQRLVRGYDFRPRPHQTLRPVLAGKLVGIMLRNGCWPTSDPGDFWHNRLRSLVFASSTGYVLTTSGFVCEIGGVIFQILFTMIGDFLAVLNFNRLYFKLNQFIWNKLPVLPIHNGPPLFSLLQPEMLTDGVRSGRCDELLVVDLDYNE